jgi:hypothetical protein
VRITGNHVHPSSGFLPPHLFELAARGGGIILKVFISPFPLIGGGEMILRTTCTFHTKLPHDLLVLAPDELVVTVESIVLGLDIHTLTKELLDL